ncbi:hypothetical protein BGW42_001012 [Actinomortierella wolfii]|nr:hypothetical protein BGW42_001012 [Actinomortierella wolfii]
MKCHQERKEAKRLREERERMERADRMMDKLLPTIPESERKTSVESHNHLQQHHHQEQQQPQSIHPLQQTPTYSNVYPFLNPGVYPSHNPPTLGAHSPQQQHSPQLSHHSTFSQSSTPDLHDSASSDMHRLPKTLRDLAGGVKKDNKVVPTPPRTDSRSKTGNTGNTGLPTIDVGPPFLPPLSFGLNEASSSSFDLSEILTSEEQEEAAKAKDGSNKAQEQEETRDSTEKATEETSPTSPPPPPLPSKDESNLFKSGLDPNALSASNVFTSPSMMRHSGSSVSTSDNSSALDSTRVSSEGTEHSQSKRDHTHDTMTLEDALLLINALRTELARFNPMSPLLHGTPYHDYGLLHEKTEKLTQKHAEVEKSLRNLYIEKDLLAMDLEAMNEELRLKEEGKSGQDTLHPGSTVNPRYSTGHELMKQAYQNEVKALQEQKENLQREIQTFMEQRETILNEMQILSVRNAELSTMNNDMMRDMQGRMDPPPSNKSNKGQGNGHVFSSFTDKMRRQRQQSGDSASQLNPPKVLGSNESTLSFSSTLSDDTGKKSRREDSKEDIFGEEIVAPKKFNWKKGATNTAKNVGAMFGKLLVDGQNAVTGANGNQQQQLGGLEVPKQRQGSFSDSSSTNGYIPPMSSSLSSNSEVRSLNGRFTDQQHQFVLHNFLRPVRCDCCDDKLWGREYKCRMCGYQIHGRCSHEIIPSCQGTAMQRDSDSSSLRGMTPSGNNVPPPPPAKQTMFGKDLLEQLELEGRLVPLVVEKCIEAVDQRGLEVEGIYRRSGMAAEARQLVQAYDIGMQPDLMDDSQYQDICSITSVLKQYLRQLPEPLIPFDLYSEFMDAVCMPAGESKIQTFRDLMERMPLAYYMTLKVLFQHLNRVVEHDHINLMHAKNLSVVFGPTLMRNIDPSREIMDMTYKNMTIEYMITNTKDLFVRNEQGGPASKTQTQPAAPASTQQPSPYQPPHVPPRRTGASQPLNPGMPPRTLSDPSTGSTGTHPINGHPLLMQRPLPPQHQTLQQLHAKHNQLKAQQQQQQQQEQQQQHVTLPHDDTSSSVTPLSTSPVQQQPATFTNQSPASSLEDNQPRTLTMSPPPSSVHSTASNGENTSTPFSPPTSIATQSPSTPMQSSSQTTTTVNQEVDLSIFP